MSKPDLAALGTLLRRSLPSMPYLKFISELLGRSEQTSYYYDPFAIDMRSTPDEEEQSFVYRSGVQDHLPGSRIILGKPGIGKTRLYRKLGKIAPNDPARTLTVAVPMETFAQEGEIQGGKISSLSMNIIIQTIFEEYWNQFIHDPYWRGRIPASNQSRDWLLRLHWFYNHYPPAWREIPSDLELTDWLSRELAFQPIRPDLSPELALEHLNKLVTGDASKNNVYPYRRIELLIDGIEQMSEYAVSRLICDIQRLYDLRLSFKLFLDSIHEEQLDNLECYRQGRISLLRLPDWTAEELVDMLKQRWWAFKGAEPDLRQEPDLSFFLHPELHRRFFARIVENTLECLNHKTRHEELAAPIHVLNMARGCLAACAGCLEVFEITPPLREEHLHIIRDSYWAAGEEKRSL